MAEAELLELFERASKAARRAECNYNIVDKDDGQGMDVSEEARCTDALQAIGALDISTALLLSTQVGKRLRKLTKHSSMKISKSAQDLLENWRKVVSTEANASKSNNIPASKKTSSSAVPPPVPAVAKTVQVKSTKVTQIKMEVKVTKSIVNNNNNAVPLKAGEKVSMVSSSTVSSSCVTEYTPEIGVIPKAPGDSARDRIREMLVEALCKVWKEAANEEDLAEAQKANIVDVAVAVENALFAKLGLSKGKEKAKYRSIMFNIKDEKNPDFRRRILLGRIKPEAIVTMTSDEMASDNRKKETEDIKAKAMFECERGMQAMASTDQFKCHKCLQRKTTYFQMQTRSADEPMTTFITCVNCNAHWKF